MLDLIKKFFGGDADSAADESLRQAMEAGLDIRAAKAAHENWKLRLEAYLAGKSNEDLRAETICFDDRCDLGKWIYSTGKPRLGNFPGFTALMADHKQFHYAASNVVALAQAGKTTEAVKMMTGPYARASAGVLGALDTLETAVKRASRASRSGAPATAR